MTSSASFVPPPESSKPGDRPKFYVENPNVQQEVGGRAVFHMPNERPPTPERTDLLIPLTSNTHFAIRGQRFSDAVFTFTADQYMKGLGDNFQRSLLDALKHCMLLTGGKITVLEP
jgi:hypothetical protein